MGRNADQNIASALREHAEGQASQKTDGEVAWRWTAEGWGRWDSGALDLEAGAQETTAEGEESENQT